jgi:hypothetical protein
MHQLLSTQQCQGVSVTATIFMDLHEVSGRALKQAVLFPLPFSNVDELDVNALEDGLHLGFIIRKLFLCVLLKIAFKVRRNLHHVLVSSLSWFPGKDMITTEFVPFIV